MTRQSAVMTVRHWQIGSWVLALLLISPLLALLGEALASEYQMFVHLWQTVLWDYIRNTLLVVLGVGGVITSYSIHYTKLYDCWRPAPSITNRPSCWQFSGWWSIWPVPGC